MEGVLLIGNGRVVTRDNKNSYYEHGGVLVEGNRIEEVGESTMLQAKYPDAEYMDAKRMVIMPGFINAHHHIYSAFARGLSIPGNAPTNFLEVLEGTWWNMDRHMSLTNTYYSAMATYMECIKNGVTTVIDHHASYGAVKGSLFEIAKAAQRLHVRTCLAYEISDRDGRKKRIEAMEETMNFLLYCNQIENQSRESSNMLRGKIGLHASFTLSEDTLRMVREENVMGAGYHIHISEGIYDELHCQKHYGTSVVRRLQDQGILGEDTIAGHCIHISEEDRKCLKDTKTIVVHNPESNMANGVGCPDVIGMLDEGICVGLGTDGYTSDMLESLKVAHLLQKHRRAMPDRGFAEAISLLLDHNREIATRVFGVDVGVLRKGAVADLILIEYSPYTPINADTIDGHIMFGMSGAMTNTTMINGKLLMRNRRLCNCMESEILAQSRSSSEELWNSLWK